MALQQDRRFDIERGKDEFRAVQDDVASIVGELRELASKEMALARAELGEQLGLSRDAAVAAGVAAVAALLTLTFAALTLMFALDEAMPLWLAALLTTAALALVVAAAAAVFRARSKRISVVPKKTLDSVNEDVQWARKQLHLNAR
jgi:uncharacterized membrane protein YqjE